MLIFLLKLLFLTISCCPMVCIDFIYYTAGEIIVRKELRVIKKKEKPQDQPSE